MNNLSYAVRRLAKAPGFTAVALLTLALGIGVNTSMFSVLRAVVLRTLPYAQPERLVHVHRIGPAGQEWPHSVANFLDLHAQQTVFGQLAAVQSATFNLSWSNQPAERLRGYAVTPAFFPLLGVSPALGRVFTSDEDQPGRHRVAVLSHRFWSSRFRGDPSIVGSDIRLDGAVVTVIGVMPASFEDPLLWGQADLWQPLAFSDSQRGNRRSNYLRAIGRVKPGITLKQAEAGLQGIWTQLIAAHPENAKTSLHLEPLSHGSRVDDGPISWFVLTLAALVLMIACANLANLQFARTSARAREHAVRSALGATRAHLMRSVLTESLLLAVVGGALGVLLALWCNDLLGRQIFVPPSTRGIEIPLDFTVLAFAIGVSTLAGVGFGVLPAWFAGRSDVNDTLKHGGTTLTAGLAQHRIRNALIVAEVALALVLLATAFVFVSGLQHAMKRDPGWRIDPLLTGSFTIQTPSEKAADQRTSLRVAFVRRLEQRIAALPGVEHVGFGTALPTYGFDNTSSFFVEGRSQPAPGAIPQAASASITSDYFSALGLPLVAGRAFNDDDRAGTRAVTIINETMARAFFPGESPLGRRIRHPDDPAWREIVGVARDAHPAIPLGTLDVGYQMYRPYSQNAGATLEFAIRTSAAPEALAPAIRRIVTELQPEQSVEEISLLRSEVAEALHNITLAGWILAAFAALGLLLAALGLYAVIANTVIHRTREIGIRMALGARVWDVLALVISQGLRLTLIGSALGVLSTLAIVRVLASILPGLEAENGIILALVTVVLITVALLACWLPARRATRVDPITALRAE